MVQQLVALVVIAVLQKVLVIQIMPLVVQIVLQQLLPQQLVLQLLLVLQLQQLHYQAVVNITAQKFVMLIIVIGATMSVNLLHVE